MPFSVNDDVLDGAWDILALGNIMTACSAEPTTRDEAITTFALADVAMAGGDYTKGPGNTSGRKVTMAQKSGVLVDTSGTANHVAICDATRLLYVTECIPQALTQGNNVTFPAWDAEIQEPAAAP